MAFNGIRRILPFLAACVLAGTPLLADPVYGAIAGRVIDATGAAVDNVLVTLSAPEATFTSTTGSRGEYRFDLVRPGSYRLSFAHPGFAMHSRALDLAPGRSLSIDATLQLSLQAEVTVTGRATFRNHADSERPEANLVGIATAASEGAVTGRQLERRPIQRVGEVLEAVPGLSVTQHSGEGKANQYYLRGFNLDHGTDFSTIVAGVPVNLPTHAHGHGYTDANFLIPELVNGIQYFKGPYSADAGDFSSAGGVNINYASVLERPIIRASTGGQGWSRLFAAASPRVEQGYLLGAVETARSDGPWTRPDHYRRNNGVIRYSRGELVDHIAVTALAYQATWNASDQVPRRAIDTGALPRFGAVDVTTGGQTGRYGTSVEWQHRTHSSSSRVTGFAVAYDLDLFSNFTYFLDDPENGDQFHQADRRVVSGVRTSHAWLTRAGARPLEYRIGMQLRRDDIGRVGLYRTRNRERMSTVREDDVAQLSSGIWTDADIRWTRWLRSIVGLRADGYRHRVAAATRESSGRDSDGLVSPKGSLVLGPWRATELYVNAGSGFHSNDARGATLRVDPVDGSPAERVTPLVRTRGAEIGARTVAIPGMQSTVTLWHLAVDSELVFVGDAGTTSASRPTDRSGLEWSTFARPTPWLTFDADVAWSHARFRDEDPAGAGNRIPGAVARVVSLGLAADGPGRIAASLRWRYFGSRPLVADNTFRSRPTSLLNAQARYRLADRVSLIADAFNLLNVRHSDVDYFYRSRLPGEPVDGIEDVHSHPALPRTLRLTLALGF